MTPNFNITELFYKAARENPQHIAIIDGEKNIDYATLQHQVDDTVQNFMQMGIRKGDRVLVFLPMSIDLYRIVLALFRLGATAVFLDEWVSKRRMEMCCRIATCKGFVGNRKARLLRLFSKELRQIPVVLPVAFRKASSNNVMEQTVADDTALITFTTGSSGTPKAARRTHGFLSEQFRALREKIDPKAGDVDMPLLPIVLLINLATGATSVITHFKSSKPQSFKPERICQNIERYGVNRLCASPVFVRLLAEHLIVKGKTLPELKQVFTGGAPLFPAEAALYQRAFKDSLVEIVYGSTEAEPISSITASELVQTGGDWLNNGLPAGKPCRQAEVKIIKITDTFIDVDSETALPLQSTNAVGEIIVAGPHVLKEYAGQDEMLKRHKIFIGDKVYHRTGDSGYLDENGLLFLTGRCAGIFESNGITIYPFLCEQMLLAIPGVSAGTVLRLGSETVAAIEPHGNKQAVESRLEKLPIHIDRVCFVKKMPRDPRHQSKIDYEALKHLLHC